MTLVPRDFDFALLQRLTGSTPFIKLSRNRHEWLIASRRWKYAGVQA